MLFAIFGLSSGVLITILGSAAAYFGGRLWFQRDTKKEQRHASYIELSQYLKELGFDYLPDILAKVALRDWDGVYETAKAALLTFKDPAMRKAHLLKILESLLRNPDALLAVKEHLANLAKQDAVSGTSDSADILEAVRGLFDTLPDKLAEKLPGVKVSPAREVAE